MNMFRILLIMKIKRVFLLAMILSLLCLPCFNASAMAISFDNLPLDIQRYFESEALDDAIVLSVYNGVEHSKSNLGIYVLVRTGTKTNTLYAFHLVDNTWVLAFKTQKAIPQTDHALEVFLSDSGEEWPTGEHYVIPHLSIFQINEWNEYPELNITFKLLDGQWMLHRIWSYTEYASMLIDHNTVSYYEDTESTKIVGTAHRLFQRNIMDFDLSELPKTLQEAREKNTAMHNSSRNELQAMDIKFAGGKKYPVYSAPNEQALRGANGKALVSTNDWIQVFGHENGWFLICYRINNSHQRIGYIDSGSLPMDTDIPSLNFTRIPTWTVGPATLTDDPLFSQNEITVIPTDTLVTWLSNIGDWAYVEYADRNNHQIARGFIDAAELRLHTTEEVNMLARQMLLTYLQKDEDTYDALLIQQPSVSYDALSGVWRIDFNAEPECSYTVMVDDRTESIWLNDLDHG